MSFGIGPANHLHRHGWNSYYVQVDGWPDFGQSGREFCAELELLNGASSAGDFLFASQVTAHNTTMPLYIASERESQPAADPRGMMGATPGARLTVTRLKGSTGRVLVDYTVTNTFYTNIFTTNYFGTNIFTTNETITVTCDSNSVPILTNSDIFYYTNLFFTNVVTTNYYENNEYGRFVFIQDIWAHSVSCTNWTLFRTNVTSTCSTVNLGRAVPTNGPASTFYCPLTAPTFSTPLPPTWCRYGPMFFARTIFAP